MRCSPTPSVAGPTTPSATRACARGGYQSADRGLRLLPGHLRRLLRRRGRLRRHLRRRRRARSRPGGGDVAVEVEIPLDRGADRRHPRGRVRGRDRLRALQRQRRRARHADRHLRDLRRRRPGPPGLANALRADDADRELPDLLGLRQDGRDALRGLRRQGPAGLDAQAGRWTSPPGSTTGSGSGSAAPATRASWAAAAVISTCRSPSPPATTSIARAATSSPSSRSRRRPRCSAPRSACRRSRASGRSRSRPAPSTATRSSCAGEGLPGLNTPVAGRSARRAQGGHAGQARRRAARAGRAARVDPRSEERAAAPPARGCSSGFGGPSVDPARRPLRPASWRSGCWPSWSSWFPAASRRSAAATTSSTRSTARPESSRSCPRSRSAAGDGLVEIETTEIPDDWADRWRDFHEPVWIGERLVVRPSWETGAGRAAPEGTVEIVIDPGRAFGTGAHATTSMCLELLLEHADGDPGRGAVCDLGHRLGRAGDRRGPKLGYGPVRGFDHEAAGGRGGGGQRRARTASRSRSSDSTCASSPAPVAPLWLANLTAPLLLAVAALLPAARATGHPDPQRHARIRARAGDRGLRRARLPTAGAARARRLGGAAPEASPPELGGYIAPACSLQSVLQTSSSSSTSPRSCSPSGRPSPIRCSSTVAEQTDGRALPAVGRAIITWDRMRTGGCWS